METQVLECLVVTQLARSRRQKVSHAAEVRMKSTMMERHDPGAGGEPRGDLATRTFRTSFIATLFALILLGWINESVSTGWRLYVLANIFKAAWAATAAVIASGIAVVAVSLLAGETQGHGRSSPSPTLNAIRSLLAFVTATAALAYFMPDWTVFTGTFAALVLMLWLVAFALAMRVRARRG
jgi:hypothetical protein